MCKNKYNMTLDILKKNCMLRKKKFEFFLQFVILFSSFFFF